MKLWENLIKKSTKTATEEVKKEVSKTIIDFIPGILAFGSMILGIFVFHATDDGSSTSFPDVRPNMSTTRITTNNYFLGDVSEEIVKKILEDK